MKNKLEKDKIYKIEMVCGNSCEFFLNEIKSFLWFNTYIVLLKRECENEYHTLRFENHPSYYDVEDLYINYLKTGHYV